MHQVIYQEMGSIELGVDGSLDHDGFQQIVHQLESLATTFGPINVMFDLTHLEGYDKSIVLDEVAFYREKGDALHRIAVVSDSMNSRFFAKLFNKILDTEVKCFPVEEVEAARRWIFVSRLP